MKKILAITIVILALIFVFQNAKADGDIFVSLNCNMQFVTVNVESIVEDTGYIYIEKENGSLEQVYFYPFLAIDGEYTWYRDDLFLIYGNNIKVDSGYFGGVVLEGQTFNSPCKYPQNFGTSIIFLPLMNK